MNIGPIYCRPTYHIQKLKLLWYLSLSIGANTNSAECCKTQCRCSGWSSSTGARVGHPTEVRRSPDCRRCPHASIQPAAAGAILNTWTSEPAPHMILIVIRKVHQAYLKNTNSIWELFRCANWMFIGPRFAWGPIYGYECLTQCKRSCRLNWCDSGWWIYKNNTEFISIER